MTTVKTKKSIKPAVVVTYVIATLALIAGWFIPIFGYGQGMDTMDMMMFWYVPAIINAFFNPYLGGNLIPGSYVGSHDLPEFAEFVSRIIKTVDIQILALMLMIYLLVTVLAIIFIIPVCVGKKEKKTSLTCAYIIEGAAIAALAILFLFATWEHDLTLTFNGYLNLVCVFGAVLLIIFIQCMVAKKSYGFLQVVMFLLSVLAFLVAMLSVEWVVVAACNRLGIGSGWWETMLNTINAGGALIVVDNTSHTGFNIFQTLVSSSYAGSEAIWSASNSITMNIANVCIIALFGILLLNGIIDFIALLAGNKNDKKGILLSHKGGKIVSLIRYLLALIIAVVLLACALADQDMNVGICLYLLMVVLLVMIIITIVRLARVPAQKRRAKEQQAKSTTLDGDSLTAGSEEQIDLIDENPAPAYTAPSYGDLGPIDNSVFDVPAIPAAEEQQLSIEDAAATPAAAPEEQATPEDASAPIVYTPRQVIYNGPTDEFIETLTTEEKIEFCKVFIDKNKGNLPAKMPEYEIGGSNDDFFPAIFINLGKFRALLSSGLLRKIYKHLNNK